MVNYGSPFINANARIYLCQLSAGDFKQTKKMLLVK